MTVTLTDIKKQTYKQQPVAKFINIRNGKAFYTFSLSFEGYKDGKLTYECQIPISDMGDASFNAEMEAKFLLRWVQEQVVGFQTFEDPLAEQKPKING